MFKRYPCALSVDPIRRGYPTALAIAISKPNPRIYCNLLNLLYLSRRKELAMSTQMPFPHQISHSPVYGLPYNGHDPDRENDSDVHWLTIGWSQWDSDIPAAKVVRHSGQRWSRQSEELPLARLVDLTTLLALAYERNADDIILEAGFLEEQSNEITVNKKSERARDRLATAMHRDPKLRRRLSKLADVLIKLRNDCQI